MNNKKIIFTTIATAMTGAFIYSFLHEEHKGIYCQLCCSNGFALATGLVIGYTFYLYKS